ncbi:hypothetical protein AGIG_G18173 [Arapaima gigas]
MASRERDATVHAPHACADRHACIPGNGYDRLQAAPHRAGARRRGVARSGPADTVRRCLPVWPTVCCWRNHEVLGSAACWGPEACGGAGDPLAEECVGFEQSVSAHTQTARLACANSSACQRGALSLARLGRLPCTGGGKVPGVWGTALECPLAQGTTLGSYAPVPPERFSASTATAVLLTLCP